MDRNKQVKKIAKRIYLLICDMAEIGEDYSLLLRQYDDMIDEYKLPLKKYVGLRWKNLKNMSRFEKFNQGLYSGRQRNF